MTNCSRFIFGAAQLGMQYGIANTTRLENKEKTELLHLAVKMGVDRFDTARAYGASEDFLGDFLLKEPKANIDIFTKISPLDGYSEDSGATYVVQMLDESLDQSMQALKLQTLTTVLLHRSQHISLWGGKAWDRLIEHKRSGKIQRLGVSLQSPEEIDLIENESDIEVVQLPFNLLDWRWDAAISKLKKLKQTRRLEVHVRSVFLQGLLLSKNDELWKRANFEDPAAIWAWLDETVLALGRQSVYDLCVSFVNSQDWVDGLVIGIDNSAQLLENLLLVQEPKLTSKALKMLEITRPVTSICSLNPALWNTGG